MRRLLTWFLVTLGIAALVRRLRRRTEPEPAVVSEPPPATEAEADPADELRQKLAETRTEPEAGPEPGGDPSVEERRAEVYEQGRSTLDEMQDTSEG